MKLKDIPRDLLNTRILQEIEQEQDMYARLKLGWKFSPQTAFTVIDTIFGAYKELNNGKDHARRSGRLTVSHLYAVGGYSDQRTVLDQTLTDNERIVGLLHDTFEDTRLQFADARVWGVEEADISTLDCLTRRIRVYGIKEPWFDFMARVAQDERAVSRKEADIKDNIYGVDPLEGAYKCRRALSLEYLKASRQPEFCVEKFIQNQRPEKIKIIFEMIRDGSSEHIKPLPLALKVAG